MLAARSGEYNWQVPASSSHVGQVIFFVACFSLVAEQARTTKPDRLRHVCAALKLFRPRSRNLKRFLSFLSNNLDALSPDSPRREDYSVLDETCNAEPKSHHKQQNYKTNPIPKMDTSPPSPNPLGVLIQPRTQTRIAVPQ